MSIFKSIARVGELAAAAANPAAQLAQGLATASQTLEALSGALNRTADADLEELLENIALERLVDYLGPDETLAFLEDLAESVRDIKARETRAAARRARRAGGADGAGSGAEAAALRDAAPRMEPRARAEPDADALAGAPCEELEGDDYAEMAAALIKAEEGYRDEVYRDGDGLAAGWGHEIKPGEKRKWKLGRAVPREQAEAWFDADMDSADEDCLGVFGEEALAAGGPARHAVLVSMLYQMGRPRVSRFTNMKTAFAHRDYSAAAHEMEVNGDGDGPSLWMEQTPERCARAARTMRTGRLWLPS